MEKDTAAVITDTKEKSDQAKEYNRMTNDPISKLIISLAVPTIISMLVTSVYNMTDTFFVSQLGTSASGATGIVFSLMAIIQAVGFTIGVGAGSTISRLLGQKKKKEADIIGSTGFATAVVLGTVIAVPGLCFLEPLMRLLGSTDSMLPYAKDYASYILLAAPVMTVSFVLNNLLRAEGKAKFSMIGIGIGGALNIVLDPIFIFGMQLGIKGAAIATSLSQCVSFLILIFMYIRKKTTVELKLSSISPKPLVYVTFLGNGMPSFFRQGLASVATIALNVNASVYGGDVAVAAMSIVGKISMLIFSVLIGFGQGYQPVAGFNYGAKLYNRVKSSYFFMLTVGTAVMTGLGILAFILAPYIMESFIGRDPEVVRIGIFALRAQCAVMPFMPFIISCNMTYQAVGKSFIATVMSACRQGIFFLPLIFILPRMFGLLGIQITQPVADVCTCLAGIPFIWRFLKSLTLPEKSSDFISGD